MTVDEKGLIDVVARAIRDTQHMPPSCDYPQCMCDYECERDTLTVATYTAAARAAITAYLSARSAEPVASEIGEEEIASLRAYIAQLEAAAPLSARETSLYLAAERRLMELEAAAIRKGPGE